MPSARLTLPTPAKIAQDLLRLWRVVKELFVGFHHFGNLGHVVTVFGSARLGEAHPAYPLMRDLTYKLGLEGFTILTGGGPGLMEAANRGAREAKAKSIACNIVLVHEQRPNAYVDFVMTMRYFFTRKYMLTSYSLGFVFGPGGLGTLDEFFEVLTLIQTGKLPRRPVFLIGVDYWRHLVNWMETHLLREGAIDRASIELFYLTDDLDLVVNELKRAKHEVDQERQPHPINSEA